MANIKLNNPLRTKIIDTGVIANMGTSAVLKVYDGTQAANAGDAATGTLLVTMTGIAWTAASNGTSAITAIKTGTAGNTGTASWARLSDVSGTAYIIDGDCGTSVTADFVIDSPTITSGAVVTLNSATLVQPAS